MSAKPSSHHNQRLSIEYRTPDSIQYNPRDPRVYNRAERRRIVRYVKRVGALPLIVNAAGEVISGNIWLEAAKDAGFTEIPVIALAGPDASRSRRLHAWPRCAL